MIDLQVLLKSFWSRMAQLLALQISSYLLILFCQNFDFVFPTKMSNELSSKLSNKMSNEMSTEIYYLEDKTVVF